MIKNASIATLAMFLSAASPAMATSDAHSLYVNLELALNQTTVGAVIQSISEQTGYEFSYALIPQHFDLTLFISS